MRLGPRDLPRKNWTPWTGGGSSHQPRRQAPSTMAKLVTGMGFTIHGALTPGSEGCVFDSSHPDYPQRVIVKAGWYTSTSHEARLLRRLDHPAILPLLDLHVVSGVTCLVLPKYQADLYTYLSRRLNPLGRPQIAAVSRQLLSAVDYIHRQGIIHRDIKTENIFINTPEDICLGDFGAACFVQGSRSSPSPTESPEPSTPTPPRSWPGIRIPPPSTFGAPVW